ncbi:MAG: TspO/MBR family protein [Chitinophagaceae bacterium]
MITAFYRLALCILIPLLVGGIAGFATIESVKTWYLTLNRPWFTPPNWLFGPVWTSLYCLMGVSLYLTIYKANTKNINQIIYVFTFQLLLNGLWSFVFFKWHLIAWALVNIVFLALAIMYMIVAFYKSNRLAAYLQIPYLLWVSFATCLNAGFWLLNN